MTVESFHFDNIPIENQKFVASYSVPIETTEEHDFIEELHFCSVFDRA